MRNKKLGNSNIKKFKLILASTPEDRWKDEALEGHLKNDKDKQVKAILDIKDVNLLDNQQKEILDRLGIENRFERIETQNLGFEGFKSTTKNTLTEIIENQDRMESTLYEKSLAFAQIIKFILEKVRALNKASETVDYDDLIY